MGKRGPAPRSEYAGQMSVLSVRITPDLRNMLDKELQTSKKTLSREVEHRLRRSFLDDDKLKDYFGSRRDYAIMKFIHATIESITNTKKPGADWTQDAYLFDQVIKAINSALMMFRPDGEPPSTDDLWEYGGERQGHVAAVMLMKDIDELKPGFDLHTSDKKQLILQKLKDDLGELVKSSKIPAKTIAKIPEEYRYIFERARKNRTSFEDEWIAEQLAGRSSRKEKM